jgi:hypothetical protein
LVLGLSLEKESSIVNEDDFHQKNNEAVLTGQLRLQNQGWGKSKQLYYLPYILVRLYRFKEANLQ